MSNPPDEFESTDETTRQHQPATTEETPRGETSPNAEEAARAESTDPSTEANGEAHVGASQETPAESADCDDDAATDPPPGLTVVGIGASAGGLAALKRFFSKIPKNPGVAFVVVVHLSPEHDSQFAELIQPVSVIPIQQVTETVELTVDRAYVIPPNRNISAIDSHLRLVPLSDAARKRAPIDHFFRTLASTHDGNAIGVILTGTGSDGALGLRHVKECGGITIVQDPREAEYDGMPQSAITMSSIDLIAPLDEIPGRILEFAKTRPQIASPPQDEEDANGRADRVRKILARVRSQTGRDFARYKRSTVMRRIERRMQLHQADTLDAYIDLLRRQPAEVQRLSDEFLITVTEFFRDKEVFARLEEDVIPALFEEKDASDQIRVWSVGCATGEEAYSLAMLLSEAASARDMTPTVQVFASDLHEESLATARRGTYPESIEATVSSERLARFFTKENDAYRVRKELREMVVFTPHNVLSDPPFSKMDLIVCRNVLIYLDRDVQGDVMSLFHYALRPDGFLVLGTSEVVEQNGAFKDFDRSACIFQKRQVPGNTPRLPVFSSGRKHSVPDDGERSEASVPYGRLHQEMVELYAPPSVLVNPQREVVHVSENAGAFLQVQGGRLTSDILQLVRDELRIELLAVMRKAEESARPARSRPLDLEVDGRTKSVLLDVRPADDERRHGYMLVLFDVRESAEELGQTESAWDEEHVSDAEAELKRTKQRLGAVIEEHETTQEEMKASNEELQSMNEELRSTMEELETSKEELQSVNEELATVNQENRHKVEELRQLADDLQNLLTSTDIATLFLDRDLRILRFTPRVGDLFNVRGTDRGRALADFTHRLGAASLMDDARQVLETLVPVDREIQSEDGHWYLTGIRPYRSAEDRIEGVVITFVDITERKQTEEALREAQALREVALDAAHMGTWILELATFQAETDLRHNQIFGYKNGLDEWSPERFREHIVPEHRHILDDAVARALETGQFEAEVQIERADGEIRWVQDKGHIRSDDQGEPVYMAGVTVDVTEAKEIEEALRRMNEDLEAAVQERTEEVRDLAANLSVAEQEERARIAQVLHDDIQQILHSIQIKVSLIPKMEDPARVATIVQDVQDMLARSTRSIRSLTVEIDPPVLHEEGLAESLRWLAAYVLEKFGLHVHTELDLDELGVLPEGKRVMLFHSARELLFNVVKHARNEDSALLRATLDDGELVVVVSDRGPGFDAELVLGEHRHGFGIANIRERLRLSGGAMEIESHPGEGTQISLRMPMGDR